jgi:hypothetical protein
MVDRESGLEKGKKLAECPISAFLAFEQIC